MIKKETRHFPGKSSFFSVFLSVFFSFLFSSLLFCDTLLMDQLSIRKQAAKNPDVSRLLTDAVSCLKNNDKNCYMNNLKQLAAADGASSDFYNGLIADESGPAGIYYKLVLKSGAGNDTKNTVWQALEAYRNSDMDNAKALLKKIPDTDPGKPAVKMFLQEIDDEVFYAPEDELFAKQARDIYNEGIKLYRKGDYENARKIFDKANDLDPVNKKLQKFYMLSKPAAVKPVGSIDSLLAQAAQLAKDRNIHDAWDIYQQILAVDPYNAQVIKTLKDFDAKSEQLTVQSKNMAAQNDIKGAYLTAISALDYSRNNKNAVANEAALQKLLSDQKTADIMYNYGADYYTQGSYNLAINAWEDVLAILPGDAQTVASIAKAQLKLDDMKAKNASTITAALKSGNDFLDQGILDKARNSFEYVLRLDPSNAEGMEKLNKVKMLQNQGCDGCAAQ